MKAWLLLADKRCNWTMATYFAHIIGEEPGNSWKDRCAWSDRDQGHTEKEKGSTEKEKMTGWLVYIHCSGKVKELAFAHT